MTAVVPIVNLQRRPIINPDGRWSNRGGGTAIVYPSGFLGRHVFSVSRLLLPATHPAFPLFVRLQHTSLRLVANGGLVQTGFDFLVRTLAGADIPYHIHTYNGATGLLELIMKVPLTFNAANTFVVYFNKAEAVTSLEDHAGSWDNKALMVYHLPSTEDYSGNNRDLDDGGVVGPTEYTYSLILTNNRIVPNTNGADLWPSTWASNDVVYATIGDGPSTNPVSLGLARINGTTISGISVTYLVGGPSFTETDHWAPIAGFAGSTELEAKCTSLIAYANDLYLWMADGPSNPDGWDNCRIGKVSIGDIAAGPTVPSWGMGQDHTWKTINPAFLQCGRGLEDGWDNYVYAFPQHYAPIDNPPGDSPSHNPAQFYLIRCLKTSNWQTQANWEWWTGGTDEAPTWGAYGSRQARITMTGPCDWRPSAFYIKAPIDRCIFRVGRTGDPAFGGGSMSRFGTWIAQRPWHTWDLIADQQYLAPGIAADLAQVSPIPNTVVVNPDGSVDWLDSVWGGSGPDGLGGPSVDSDKFIVTRSTLTPVP